MRGSNLSPRQIIEDSCSRTARAHPHPEYHEMIKLSAIFLFVVVTCAQALKGQTPTPLPLKYVGPPTVPAITAGDLMTRLYKYADDSLMGRGAASVYNLKATAYIEAEVRQLGLVPAGDSGGYFQDIGMMHPSMELTSTMSIDGTQLRPGVDFLANTYGSIRKITNAPVLLWDTFDSTTAPTFAQLAGKVVLLRTYPARTREQMEVWRRSPLADLYRAIEDGSSGAVGIIVSAGDSIPVSRMKEVTDPDGRNAGLPSPSKPMIIVVPSRFLTDIFGGHWTTVPSGTVGKPITLEAKIRQTRRGGRNVVAILRGSDPKLRNEYIALGAHNDHVGYGTASFGLHDSLRIVNPHVRPAGSERGRNLETSPVTDAEWTEINAAIAQLRRVYPERPDSIFNGADDDGSGTVSLLEIAEALAHRPVAPKRSILFVWHTGEEWGMLGSGYFMDHPSVPREAIVAQLNIDMVGHGASTDMTGQALAPAGQTGEPLHGGDRYLQVIGPRRLSPELGEIIEKVNSGARHRFSLDYRLDAPGHQQNLYCRSDHWSYAKWGIPVAFFTTGGHADYHQVTDEPQYIRYDHMAAVDSLILDVALSVANMDHRVAVNRARSAEFPAKVCKQ